MSVKRIITLAAATALLIGVAAPAAQALTFISQDEAEEYTRSHAFDKYGEAEYGAYCRPRDTGRIAVTAA